MFGHHSTSLLHTNHPPHESTSNSDIKSASSSHSYNKFLLNSYNNPKITYSNNNNNEKIINKNNNNNNNNIGDGIGNGDYVDEQSKSQQQHKRNNKHASSSQAQWSFQVMPSLYSLYQKVTISLMNVCVLKFFI